MDRGQGMTRLEANDLLMTAYLGALKRTYPHVAVKLGKEYEIHKAEYLSFNINVIDSDGNSRFAYL